MALGIYRVTVRGQFDDLDPAVRRALVDEADEHDAMAARFDAAGTFTYDRRLQAFSFRYEIRVDADDREHADASAVELGTHQATRALDDAGIGYKRLRVSFTNMADMW